jgi:hypothetical protein
LVVYCQQGPAHVECSGTVAAARQVRSEGDDRQEAEHADEDEDRFDGPRGDVSESDAFADTLDDREYDDGCGYAADGQHDLEQGADGYPGVVIPPEDVAGVVQQWVVEPEGRDGEHEGAEEPGSHHAGGSLLGVSGSAKSRAGHLAFRADAS